VSRPFLLHLVILNPVPHHFSSQAFFVKVVMDISSVKDFLARWTCIISDHSSLGSSLYFV